MIRYEWDVETYTDDEFADVVDHCHISTYARAIDYMARYPAEAGHRHVLVLVRDVIAPDGDLRDRQWAYMHDGILPSHFEDSGGNRQAKVPQYLRKEWAR